MLVPGLTTAGGPAAVFGDLHERPGEERAGPSELLDAGVAHSPDQGRVSRHLHGGSAHKLIRRSQEKTTWEEYFFQ
jgi:hypothetical protein